MRRIETLCRGRAVYMNHCCAIVAGSNAGLCRTRRAVLEGVLPCESDSLMMTIRQAQRKRSCARTRQSWLECTRWSAMCHVYERYLFDLRLKHPTCYGVYEVSPRGRDILCWTSLNCSCCARAINSGLAESYASLCKKMQESCAKN